MFNFLSFLTLLVISSNSFAWQLTPDWTESFPNDGTYQACLENVEGKRNEQRLFQQCWDAANARNSSAKRATAIVQKVSAKAEMLSEMLADPQMNRSVMAKKYRELAAELDEAGELFKAADELRKWNNTMTLSFKFQRLALDLDRP